jgi:threonine synthase
MRYYSTNSRNAYTTFEDAVLKGLAEDGGLFFPQYIPEVGRGVIKRINEYSFHELAHIIAEKYVEDEIPEEDLRNIIESAINFPAPLVPLNEKLNILELFHGPTLAFKDFGARFMAHTMSYFVNRQNEKLNILVATSGDTGSAVASGFFDTEGIDVHILYPSNKVSELQEKQLTTYGGNITALEVEGTFDDCQKLVKDSFVDPDLKKKIKLSSANSINIARLIPQVFYYFEAFKQIEEKKRKVIYSVPSGNLGNITAGLIGKKMGLPISTFVGATNINRSFTDYINTGVFNSTEAVKTLSNAMDVGNPSNLKRIEELYNFKLESIQEDIYSYSFDDEQTIKGMKELFLSSEYIIDPHGSVGYLALKKYVNDKHISDYTGIVLETAHYSKFMEIVENTIDTSLEMPKRLQACIDKKKSSIKLAANYTDFKEYLLSLPV